MPKSCSSVNNSLEIFKPCKTHWSIIHHYPHLMTLGHCRLLDLNQSILWKTNCMIPVCTRNLQTLAGKNQDSLLRDTTRRSFIKTFHIDPCFTLPSIFGLQGAMFEYPRLAARWIAWPSHTWSWRAGGRRWSRISWAKWSCWRLSSPLLRGFSNQTSMGMFSTRLNWDLWNPIYIYIYSKKPTISNLFIFCPISLTIIPPKLKKKQHPIGLKGTHEKKKKKNPKTILSQRWWELSRLQPPTICDATSQRWWRLNARFDRIMGKSWDFTNPFMSLK